MPDGVLSRQKMEGVRYGLNKPDISADPHRIPYVTIDSSLCKKCGNCHDHCHTSAITHNHSGFMAIDPMRCLNCGQCLIHCPHGAIIETRSALSELDEALDNSETHVIALIAPSVSKMISDSFLPRGKSIPRGRLVHALRAIGFSMVWDIESGADTAVSLETDNLIDRISRGDMSTVFTSCCPSFVKYAETSDCRSLTALSEIKSPVAITAERARTVCSTEHNVSPSHITTAAIMPCIAKKYESILPRNMSGGKPDTNIVLTVREIAHLLKERGIDLSQPTAHDEDLRPGQMRNDHTRFADSDGVMDSILRTLTDRLNLESVPKLRAVHGRKGIKSAAVNVYGKKIRFAVAEGMEAARILHTDASQHTSQYQLIEVLACPGGCSHGGGRIVHQGIMSSAKRTLVRIAKILFPQKKTRKCA